MDLGLIGKRAIVTGASRGIGLACATALAVEGVDVLLLGRNRPRLDEAAVLVRHTGRRGTRTSVAVADTTDDDAIRAAVNHCVHELGGVDILVNAAAPPAGIGPAPGLADLTDAALLGEIDTKVVGYLRCARAVAPHMIAAGWGRIVNISGYNARRTGSISGTVRNAAVAALTANLADELGPAGINVTVVHPGPTETDRTPEAIAERMAETGEDERTVRERRAAATSVGRMITAAEVSDVVAFLASPRAAAVTGDAVGAGGGNRGSVHY